MSFSVTILGTSSAIQAHGRNQSAQIVKVFNEIFLIDCGEGTQAILKKYKVNFNKINHILISHLHGDHYLGLFGLLSTMSLLGRTKPLNLFGPKGLKEIISIQLKYGDMALNYEVIFSETQVKEKAIIFKNGFLEVSSFPLIHRVDCTGFLIKETNKPFKINTEDLPHSLSNVQYNRLKKGESFVLSNGFKVEAEKWTLPPKKARSYAYCSDTMYNEKIIPYIKEVDLLYHESTFIEAHADRTISTMHSTAREAATIAKKADVKKLMLGHFSTRYKDLDQFLVESTEIFPSTILAKEGNKISIEES